MRIGVDLDNVINDLGPLLQRCVHEHFGRYLPLYEIYKNYSLKDSLGITRFEEILFWQKYGIQIARDSPPQRYCRWALQYLQACGFRVYIITSRPIIMKPITQKWLETHQIPYDEIRYGIKNKGEECTRLEIQWMIEDADHNIINLVQNKIPTIVLPYPYNQYIRHKYLVHLKDWRYIPYFLLSRRIKAI